MDKERQKEFLAQTLEISRRQAQSARRIQDIALERLSSLDPITLTNQELLRYLEIGMKLEREALAYGNITSSTEETANEDAIIADRLIDDLLKRSKMLLEHDSL
jgi:hypothetical protein